MAAAIALLGIPTEAITIDLNAIVFKMLTLRGIYGREMYETWYKMTVMLQSGLDIAAGHHPSVRVPRLRGGLRGGPVGRVRQGHHGLDDMTDPLAFLDDELAQLREQHLYRPLRVMSSAQGPIVSVDERRARQPVVERLPRPDPPSAPARGGPGRPSASSASAAVRSGRSPGTMSMHEALEAELAEFKGTPAVLTFQSGFTANTGLIPVVTGETDLIVSDALNHASIIDGMRLSKAPRKIYPHGDVEALREILREARETGRSDGAGAVPAHPGRHRRRLQHGRRHRAAPRRSSRRPKRTGRPSWSTTRTPRVCWAGTAAGRSTTSGSTDESRSRSARCPRRSARSAATSPAARPCATS